MFFNLFQNSFLFAVLADSNNYDRADGFTVSLPVAAAKKLFHGAMVSPDAGGDMEPLTIPNEFRGINNGEADNTDGADGDINAEIFQGTNGKFRILTGLTVTNANVDAQVDVFAVNDNIADLTLTVGSNTKVGIVVAKDVVGSGTGNAIVEMNTQF